MNELQSTYIEGLDLLLSKKDQKQGFSILPGKPLSILLKGGAGSGKTTLSLQLASNIASNNLKNNQYCLYLYAEQSKNEIACLFQSFKWTANLYGLEENINGYNTYDASNESWSKFSSDFVRNGQPISGVFIYDMKNQGIGYKIEKIREKVEEIVEQKFNKIWPRLIVIDSLNLLQTEETNSSNPGDITEIIKRDTIHDIVSEIYGEHDNNTPIFLFTLEKHDDMKINKFDYFFSMVIDLSEAFGTGYYFRYIQIEKARNQDHVLGKHQYKIDIDSRGMKIIPSLHYVLSRYRGDPVNSETIISTGIPGLDKILMSNKGKEGILEKSATVLLGETGAKKTPLALNFLSAGVQKNERVLYLSLREDESNVLRTLKSYGLVDMTDISKHKIEMNCISRQDCKLKEKLESLKPLDSLCLLKIKYIRPGFVTPEEFVARVLDIINQFKICQSCSHLMSLKGQEDKRNELEELEQKIEKLKFKRVVLDDIAQFDLRFPLFAESPILLSTLIDVFKSNGITSMFIDVFAKTEAESDHKPFYEIVDNVFYVRHLSFYGKNRIGISVGRLHGAVYTSDYKEVCIEKEQNGVDEISKISIEPNFERFVKIESGEPVYPPIEVSLYEESFSHDEFEHSSIDRNSHSHKFNNLIHSSLQSVIEGELKIKRITRDNDESYHFSIWKKKDVPLTSTKVVTIDEFWVNNFIGNINKPEDSCLINLSDSQYKKDIFNVDQDFKNEFRYKKGPIPHKRDEYVIPYLLNMQLLCYNKKLLEALRIKIKDDTKLANIVDIVLKEEFDFENADYIKGINNWENLASLYDKFKSYSEEQNKEFLIYYGGDEHAESCNCLFLDLLWNNKASNELNIAANTISDEQTINNISSFLKISTQHNHKPVNKEDKNKVELPKSLFWVSWYTDLIRDIKKLEKQKDGATEIANIGIAPMPNRGISGEWFLGVLKSSVSPVLGAEAVKYISSTELDREKLAFGVGLPVKNLFYEGPVFNAWDKHDLEKLVKVFDHTHSRSGVKYEETIDKKIDNMKENERGYIDIREDLEICFSKLRKLKYSDTQKISETILEMKGKIKKKLTT